MWGYKSSRWDFYQKYKNVRTPDLHYYKRTPLVKRVSSFIVLVSVKPSQTQLVQREIKPRIKSTRDSNISVFTGSHDSSLLFKKKKHQGARSFHQPPLSFVTRATGKMKLLELIHLRTIASSSSFMRMRMKKRASVFCSHRLVSWGQSPGVVVMKWE